MGQGQLGSRSTRPCFANEQVIAGRGWRSGALVENREMPVWYFRITKYADELLDALGDLKRWPEKVRIMQANWIGRSEGLTMNYALAGGALPGGKEFQELEVFTTRADTIFGGSFCALSPGHPLTLELAKNNPDLAASSRNAVTRHLRGGPEPHREEGLRHGADRGAPALPGSKAARLRRQFRPDGYGTGAIFGIRLTTSATSRFATKYALRSYPWWSGRSGPRHIRPGGEAYVGPGRIANSTS